MKKSFRVDEVAAHLAVTRRTVERWIKKGALDSYKIGGTRRVDAKEIERAKKKDARSS